MAKIPDPDLYHREGEIYLNETILDAATLKDTVNLWKEMGIAAAECGNYGETARLYQLLSDLQPLLVQRFVYRISHTDKEFST